MLVARFSRPRDDRPRQTCLSTFDSTYAILTSLKLSILNLPGWDLRLVRKELDFDEFLGKQIQDLKVLVGKRRQAIKENCGANVKELLPSLDQYEHLLARLSALQISLRVELAATIPPEGDGETAQAGFADPETAPLVPAAGPVPDVAFPSESFSFEGLPQEIDGAFWQDVCRLNEWETDFFSLLGWGTAEAPCPGWTCPGRPQ